MSKKPVGSVIKSIIAEKNLSADQVAKLIGKSKAQVYNDYNRVNMKDDEIERYAKGLQVEKAEVYKMMSGDTQSESESGGYLVEHLAALEAEFKKFSLLADHLQNQLAIKDRQIEKLMDLLGKLDPAIDTSKMKPMYGELKAVC